MSGVLKTPYQVDIPVKCRPGEVSDGHHTFDELYAHRNELFLGLMLSNPDISWFAQKHQNGTMWEGWFIAGMQLPTGTITYHLPVELYKRLIGSNVKGYSLAPEWDGHTPDGVLEQLIACNAERFFSMRAGGDRTTDKEPGVDSSEIRDTQRPGGGVSSPATQNMRGEWVAAIPLPLDGLKKICQCKRSFWTLRAYRLHYALDHIVDGVEQL